MIIKPTSKLGIDPRILLAEREFELRWCDDLAMMADSDNVGHKHQHGFTIVDPPTEVLTNSKKKQY